MGGSSREAMMATLLARITSLFSEHYRQLPSTHAQRVSTIDYFPYASATLTSSSWSRLRRPLLINCFCGSLAGVASGVGRGGTEREAGTLVKMSDIHIMWMATQSEGCLMNGCILSFMEVAALHAAIEEESTRSEVVNTCLITHGDCRWKRSCGVI